MTGENDPVRTLRHDIANPLAAILAEAQLQLLNPERLSDEALKSFKEIERLSRKMREILQTTV